MKIVRGVCIVVTAIGALMLALPHEQSFDTLPFPTAGLTVKMLADISHEGEYHLVAAMPKVVEEHGLSGESVPCALAIRIAKSGGPPITNRVTSLSRHSEFGFARIQQYESGNDWHLARGEYEISITSLKDCSAAVSRGATLSIEQNVSHITERFLAAILRYWSGVVFLCIGLIGLVLCETRWANNGLHWTRR